MTDHSNSVMLSEFTRLVRRLIGRRCWAAIAGESTDSSVLLEFESKLPRMVPIVNPHLSEDERYHEGEISLYIDCAWRLDSETNVLCGSTDSPAKGGAMLAGLSRLVDREIESAQIEPPAFDLTLKFGGGPTLKVFCEETNLENDYDNYWLKVKPEGFFIVGPRGQLRRELPDEKR